MQLPRETGDFPSSSVFHRCFMVTNFIDLNRSATFGPSFAFFADLLHRRRPSCFSYGYFSFYNRFFLHFLWLQLSVLDVVLTNIWDIIFLLFFYFLSFPSSAIPRFLMAISIAWFSFLRENGISSRYIRSISRYFICHILFFIVWYI